MLKEVKTMSEYRMPHDEIARDVADGREVVVFCDNDELAKAHMSRVAGELMRMGRDRSELRVNHRGRTVRIEGGGIASFILTARNAYNGRGMSVDKAYISESARMQMEYAGLMTMHRH